MPDYLVRRFRFVPPGTPITALYRAFRQPTPVMVVEDAVMETEPEGTNELRILAKLPAGFPSLRVKSSKAQIEWRPQNASVDAPDDMREDLVSALVEFTQYERELRRLEAALAETRAEAERDTEFAYRIRQQDVLHCDRVTELIRFYAKLRFDFAQLDFFLHTPCGELTAVAKRWYVKLMEKVDAAARAEAFDAQLELREELYEGAADRFTDYWGWAHGHKLEVIIIVLLVLEFFVMATDLVLHLRDM